MRIDSPEFESEVRGSTYADRLEVNAWRGGTLVGRDLPVVAWSLGWDATRQVQGQGSFRIADPEGVLAPWSLADPLGPGGSRLQATWVSGLSGLRVPLGWWRIRKADPTETWRLLTARTPAPNGSGVTYASTVLRVSGGGSVQVDADEETATVVLNRMDAEVVTEATCVAEIRRLLQDICPVIVDPQVQDRGVPASEVYSEARMDAVDDLLAVLNATHRMGPDGSLQIVPAAGVGPVWVIDGGDQGALISTQRALSDSGVYNVAISSNETPDGVPLVGRAYLTSGPLAWGGPFGKVPVFHRAVATEQTSVQADAETVLATNAAAGEVDLEVRCLAHPGIQPNDRVTVLSPTVAGDEPLTGRVVAMTLAASASDAGITPAKSMGLTVRVAAGDLEAIASRVRRRD